MANHASAKKRARQTEKRGERNMARISRMRTFIRKAREAIAATDKTQADAAFKQAMSELHRAVGKGLVKKNTASRRISRLNAALKAQKAE